MTIEERTRERLLEEMGRRDFLRSSAAGLAAAAAAVASAAFGTAHAPPRQVTYLGARPNPGSPAPFGAPIIPLALAADGFVEVVPQNLAAHRIASLDSMPPGLSEDWAGDDRIRFHVPPDRVQRLDPETLRRTYPWFDRMGEPVARSDLAALASGSAIAFAWRSDGQETGAFRDDVLRGILLRVDPRRMKGEPADHLMLADPSAIAFNATCTHLCCVLGCPMPGPAEPPTWERLVCPCHGSTFDPYDVATYSFDPAQGHHEILRSRERAVREEAA